MGEWKYSFMHQLLYPWERSPWNLLVWRLDGPQSQSGCGGKEKNPCHCRQSNPGNPACSLVTKHWLSYDINIMLTAIDLYHCIRIRMSMKDHQNENAIVVYLMLLTHIRTRKTTKTIITASLLAEIWPFWIWSTVLHYKTDEMLMEHEANG
jgi:hypothetical protein